MFELFDQPLTPTVHPFFIILPQIRLRRSYATAGGVGIPAAGGDEDDDDPSGYAADSNDDGAHGAHMAKTGGSSSTATTSAAAAAAAATGVALGVGGRPLRFACLTCRSRKVKCSGDRPACQGCVKAAVECVWPLRKRRKRSRQEMEAAAAAAAAAAAGLRAPPDDGGAAYRMMMQQQQQQQQLQQQQSGQVVLHRGGGSGVWPPLPLQQQQQPPPPRLHSDVYAPVVRLPARPPQVPRDPSGGLMSSGPFAGAPGAGGFALVPDRSSTSSRRVALPGFPSTMTMGPDRPVPMDPTARWSGFQMQLRQSGGGGGGVGGAGAGAGAPVTQSFTIESSGQFPWLAGLGGGGSSSSKSGDDIGALTRRSSGAAPWSLQLPDGVNLPSAVFQALQSQMQSAAESGEETVVHLSYYRVSGTTSLDPGINRISFNMLLRSDSPGGGGNDAGGDSRSASPLSPCGAPAAATGGGKRRSASAEQRQSQEPAGAAAFAFDAETDLPPESVWRPLFDLFFVVLGQHFPSISKPVLERRMANGIMSTFFLT
ncbi:hypothetical protein HK405_000771, partial [Cladochytrium tenue]